MHDWHHTQFCWTLVPHNHVGHLFCHQHWHCWTYEFYPWCLVGVMIFAKVHVTFCHQLVASTTAQHLLWNYSLAKFNQRCHLWYFYFQNCTWWFCQSSKMASVTIYTKCIGVKYTHRPNKSFFTQLQGSSYLNNWSILIKDTHVQ